MQELDSQRPGADQTSVKPLKAGVNEYIAAEAGKHIGETATVVGKVECTRRGKDLPLFRIGRMHAELAVLDYRER